MKNEIKRVLLSSGANMVGFAHLHPLPDEVRDGMPRAVAFAVAFRPEILVGLKEGPTREYYEEIKRINGLLLELSESTAALLRQHGFRAVSSAATHEGIDPETHSTRLPQKTIATLAGLGWIGKSALLVTEEFGPAVRLNRVLTDAPLPPASPVKKSRCGECRACVDACPGDAPSGKEWNAGRHRDEFFDASACRRAALEIAQRKVGIADTFCGICIAACPWTGKYVRRHMYKTDRR